MAIEAEANHAEQFERVRIKDRLRKAGMSEVESDEVAALFIEMLYRERQEWERRAGLATKQDLGASVNELKTALSDAEGRLDKKTEQACRNSASTKTEIEKLRGELRKLFGESERRIFDSLASRNDLDEIVKRLEAEIKAAIATNSKELAQSVAEASKELSERVSASSKELSERVSDSQRNLLRWAFALVVGVGITVIAATMEPLN